MNELKSPPKGAVALKVTFQQSGKTVDWDPNQESLLELAEGHGLSPAYSCRSGFCTTCQCRLLEGEIEYTDPAVLPPEEDGEIFVCCAVPTSDVVVDL